VKELFTKAIRSNQKKNNRRSVPAEPGKKKRKEKVHQYEGRSSFAAGGGFEKIAADLRQQQTA